MGVVILSESSEIRNPFFSSFDAGLESILFWGRGVYESSHTLAGALDYKSRYPLSRGGIPASGQVGGKTAVPICFEASLRHRRSLAIAVFWRKWREVLDSST